MSQTMSATGVAGESVSDRKVQEPSAADATENRNPNASPASKPPGALTGDEELARFLQEQEELLAHESGGGGFGFSVPAAAMPTGMPMSTEGMTEDEKLAWQFFQEEQQWANAAGGAVTQHQEGEDYTDESAMARTPLEPRRLAGEGLDGAVYRDARDWRLVDDDEEEFFTDEEEEGLEDDSDMFLNAPAADEATDLLNASTESESGQEGEEASLPASATSLLGGGNEAYELLLRLEEWAPPVSKGVTEETLEELPCQTLTDEMIKKQRAANASEKTSEAVEEEDSFIVDCNICLGEFEAGEESKSLPCSHVYHAACIDQWLLINKICPVCRHEIKA